MSFFPIPFPYWLRSRKFLCKWNFLDLSWNERSKKITVKNMSRTSTSNCMYASFNLHNDFKKWGDYLGRKNWGKDVFLQNFVPCRESANTAGILKVPVLLLQILTVPRDRERTLGTRLSLVLFSTCLRFGLFFNFWVYLRRNFFLKQLVKFMEIRNFEDLMLF